MDLSDLFKQFAEGIGLNQNPPETRTGIPSLQPPSMSGAELLFRTLAGASPFVAQAFNRRYPTIGSSIATIGTGLAGAFSGTLADELARQRMDPMAQQLRIAGQLQELGTRAGPPEIPDLRQPGTTFDIPAQPPTIGEQLAMSGKPAPMQVGPPRFDYNYLPTQYQIAFAKELAPLQQAKAAQAQIEASRAETALREAQRPHVEAQTRETLQDIATKKTMEAERTRQLAANETFRQFYLANPNVTPQQLGQKAAQLGVDDKALEPILKPMETQSQIDLRKATMKHYDDSIAVQRETRATLASQFQQNLAKGDRDELRRIAGDQLKGTDNTIRQLQAGIVAAQNVLKTTAPITATPEQQKQFEQDQADARVRLQTFTQQLPLEQQAKKKHEDILKELFKETPLGAKVFGRVPEPEIKFPPVSPIGPVQFKVLEDFINYQEKNKRR